MAPVEAASDSAETPILEFRTGRSSISMTLDHLGLTVYARTETIILLLLLLLLLLVLLLSGCLS